MRRSGFTLIELLVVIAIIAILAAILFPVMAAAKKQAITVRCTSNLKQIGYAVQMYVDDNGGRFPMWWIGNARPPQGWNNSWNSECSGWVYACLKYSKTKTLTACPGDPRKNKIWPGNRTATSFWTNKYCNLGAYIDGNGQATNAPALYSAFRHFKTCPYMTECPVADGNTNGHFPPGSWGGWSLWEATPPMVQEALTRHNGGASTLFLDWHVGIVKQEEWKTDLKGTTNNNPLSISSKWGERGDGIHPWFRGD